MSTPAPLDAGELRDLLTLIADPDDGDHEPSSHHHTRHRWRITGIQPRATHLTRVSGVVTDTDLRPWCVPNLALRLELPVQPPELRGIPGAPTTASRVYTVAEADPDTQRISIDFVVHDGDSPAMLWLRAVQVDDVVEIWNQQQHRLPLVSSDHVLLADSTGLPAAKSILRGLHLPGRVRLLAQVPDDELPSLPGTEVHQVTGSLIDGFLGIDLSGVDSVWAAAESSEIRPVRHHCRRVLGLPKEATQVYGYWRNGASNTQIDIDRLRMLREAIASEADRTDLEQRMEEDL